MTDLLPAASFTQRLLAAALALAALCWVSVGCVACGVADAELPHLAGAWSAPCCMPAAGAAAAAAATMRASGAGWLNTAAAPTGWLALSSGRLY